VRIRAPQGARIALAVEGGYGDSRSNETLVGMQIGPVYRLHVTEIPNNLGLELFPTVEVIDRLYPPPGLATRYPVPVELTIDELELAARGSFVTRVIYVEDPLSALPVAEDPDGVQSWIEAAPGADPLVSADERGRPVAILRIGGRVPSSQTGDGGSFHGVPPYMLLDPAAACPSDEPAANEMLEAANEPDSFIKDLFESNIGPILDIKSASETPPTSQEMHSIAEPTPAISVPRSAVRNQHVERPTFVR